MRKKTNEWEFQGEALSWINQELSSREYGFQSATQEFPDKDGKRRDIVVWVDRAIRDAVLTIELKQPSVSLSNTAYQRDAVEKAQKVAAPYLSLWNMRDTHLFRTPEYPREDLLPQDLLVDFETITQVARVDDWLTATAKTHLKKRARDLVVAAYDLVTKGTVHGLVVDSTVFVEILADRVSSLKAAIRSDFASGLARNNALRKEINSWATKQGLAGFVDDLYAALASQLAYRLVGQALFYHAYRRREPKLPALVVDEKKDVTKQLRSFWDVVRAFDYEALYEKSPIERVPLSKVTQEEIARLINDLSGYDWDSIQEDVLGSIFEQMIPEPERIALGQYYTNPHLADLIVSFCHGNELDPVLDPGVGTGTFLVRAHDRLARSYGVKHEDALEVLWGIDISAFPAELAVINLCRLSLESAENFPRIAVRDFFVLKPTDALEFPPAKRNPGSTAQIAMQLPQFGTVVGNPPYVRSQQLDDLDSAYKQRLHTLAVAAGAPRDSKFDAYVYFFVHALAFLKEGGRLGFVTSAAWLTSDYGEYLQRFLLTYFQPIVVLWSESEPLFPSQDVDTVVTVVEKLDASARRQPRGEIRFVTLKQPLSELLPEPSLVDYWARVDLLTDEIEASGVVDNVRYRVHICDGENERKAVVDQGTSRNWARPLKTTPIYTTLFGS